MMAPVEEVAQAGRLVLGGLQRRRQVENLAELIREPCDRVGQRGQRDRQPFQHLDVLLHRVGGPLQGVDPLVQPLIQRRMLLELLPGAFQEAQCGARGVDGEVEDHGRAQLPGVTRKASKTESMLRRRLIVVLSVWVSAHSTTKRLRIIGGFAVHCASTMFIPASEKVRERSSNRRWRSQPSIWISTLKPVVCPPSHATGVKRSGSRLSAFALEQSSRWMVIPRPSEM